MLLSQLIMVIQTLNYEVITGRGILNLETTKTAYYELKELKLFTRQLTKQLVVRQFVVNPGICSRCGKNKNIHAHHPDYTEPKIIVWLCKSCHSKLNTGTRNRKREVGIFIYYDEGRLKQFAAWKEFVETKNLLRSFISSPITPDRFNTETERSRIQLENNVLRAELNLRKSVRAHLDFIIYEPKIQQYLEGFKED